jgi:flagellar hook-length control protein FliK
MTLVALSPAPTAAPSVVGPDNSSASATGFGVVMTVAKAALAVAPVASGELAATVLTATVLAASVFQGIAASVTATGTPDNPAKRAAKNTADPASPAATDQPVPDTLSVVTLPIALPALSQTMVPPGALSISPQPATGPLTDASTDTPAVPLAAPTAAAAGPLSATGSSRTAVSAEAIASTARPAGPTALSDPSTSPIADASTDTPAAPSAAPTSASANPLSATPTPAASTLPAARTRPASPATDAAAPLSIATPPIATPLARLEAAAAPIPTAGPTPAQNTSFAGQLARPIFTLAAAGPGSHTMTISITPDTLGPVTVRAHVSPEGIRVELFAPTDLGRDAIRAILPDLRKDLAGAGVGANLDLSSQNQPSDFGDRRGDTGSRPGRAYIVPTGILADEDDVAPTRILTTSSIDVLA